MDKDAWFSINELIQRRTSTKIWKDTQLSDLEIPIWLVQVALQKDWVAHVYVEMFVALQKDYVELHSQNPLNLYDTILATPANKFSLLVYASLLLLVLFDLACFASSTPVWKVLCPSWLCSSSITGIFFVLALLTLCCAGSGEGYSKLMKEFLTEGSNASLKFNLSVLVAQVLGLLGWNATFSTNSLPLSLRAYHFETILFIEFWYSSGFGETGASLFFPKTSPSTTSLFLFIT